MAYKLGSSSKRHLSEAKPELQAVVTRALQIVDVDFSIVDCRRTIEEQQQNIKDGVSWSMNSRHLPDPVDNFSFAVDIYPWQNGTNHSLTLYNKIAKAMFRAAIELGVDIEWGGFWETPDCPHWQLSRRKYPKGE